jgi:hypothetical protein
MLNVETEVKIIFTVFGVVVGLWIWLVRPGPSNAGPDWLWAGWGKRNPIRWLVFREDGSYRRYAKAGILLWFVAYLAILWLLL